MQFTAKLIDILEPVTGTGKNGNWKKNTIIVETDGQYPKKVCIVFWDEKIGAGLLNIGAELTISFDVESREFNGKWYTDVKAWKIESENAANFPKPDEPVEPKDPAIGDDLPF